MAIRLATRWGASTVTGAALSGWGWWFQGAALIYEGAAIYFTPTALQAWITRTRFGSGAPRMFTSSQEEQDELEKLLKPKEEDKEDKPTPKSAAVQNAMRVSGPLGAAAANAVPGTL